MSVNKAYKTPKSKVGGDYFKNIENSLTTTKTTLEKIVSDMKEKGNPNASKTEVAVTDLNKKLTQIIEGAKDAIKGAGSGELLGHGATNASATGSKGDNVKNLVKGIKDIVNVVLDSKEGNPAAGTNKKADDIANGRTGGNNVAGEAGKLFNDTNADTTTNAKKSAADAAKAVGAVTGADILQAIAKGEDGGAFKLANAQNNDQPNTQQDAVIAGAIALRAMAKGGKFSGPSDDDRGVVAPIVTGAAVSAVTKALGTLTMAIKKTVDEGLKEVKEAMKINPEDTPMTTEAKNQ